jgi:hypothetical protein
MITTVQTQHFTKFQSIFTSERNQLTEKKQSLAISKAIFTNVLYTFTMRMLFALLFLLFTGQTQARQVTAITSGYWGSASTWNLVPTCGDTITIPNGITVTVNSQAPYPCTTTMHVVVAGILQFINGYKLTMPCGSTVEILVNGILRKASAGGGNSTLIEICGQTVWNAAAGDIPGYALLPNFGTLPVNWLHIEATRETNQVNVKWSTAAEYNNDYFTVERSTDQYNFEAIGKVQGAGTTTIMRSYSFADNQAPSGIVFYRIRQTDFDGATELSKVTFVSGKITNRFELIAVNSMRSATVNVVFTEPEASMCIWNVLDMSGRIIDYGSVEAGTGVLTRQMDCPALSRGGVYVLQLSNGREIAAKRFIKE